MLHGKKVVENNNSFKKANTLHKSQITVTVLLSLIFGLIFNKTWILPAITGGVVVILPAYLFRNIALDFSSIKTSAKVVLRRFYLAELVKVGITILLFVLCLKLLKINPVGFFVSFVVVQVFTWVLYFRNLLKS